MYGCIPGLFAVLFFFIIFIVVTILRIVFAARRTVKRFMNGAKETAGQEEWKRSENSTRPTRHKGKHFGRDEGIYVDFEEVD